jgi:uncharacterized phage-associated protein
MPIRFNMNKQRAIEAVLWIIQNGESDMHKIWKMLYSAEKYHLNEYGCPITGDQYAAMKYGVVPVRLYDETGTDACAAFFFRQGNSLIANRKPNMDYLSQSHIEALTRGFDEYFGLDFNAVTVKNHEDPAWAKNHVCGKRNLIPYEDIIEEDWLKGDLAIVSNCMAV